MVRGFLKALVGVLGVTLQIQAASTINIAVIDLEPNGIQAYEARTLSDKLRFELLNTGVFTVVERSQMEDILKEQGFQQTGCTSQECAVEIGQLIGVRKMVMGSIGVIGNTFLLSLRMINVENGRIEKMIQKEFEGNLSEILKTGIRASVQELLGLSVARSSEKNKPAAKKEVAEKAAPRKDKPAVHNEPEKREQEQSPRPVVKTSGVNNPNKPVIEVNGKTFKYVCFEENPGAYENRFNPQVQAMLSRHGFEIRKRQDRPGTLSCRIFLDSPTDGQLVASVRLSNESAAILRADQPVDNKGGSGAYEGAIASAVSRALQELDSQIASHRLR